MIAQYETEYGWLSSALESAFGARFAIIDTAMATYCLHTVLEGGHQVLIGDADGVLSDMGTRRADAAAGRGRGYCVGVYQGGLDTINAPFDPEFAVFAVDESAETAADVVALLRSALVEARTEFAPR